MDVESRKTIEALRAGVPNRDAVRQLGSNNPAIEERFRTLLSACQSGASNNSQADGFVIGGVFGAGKSHVLQHLEHIALDERFVVSTVTISKETALSDPVRLFQAAAAQARVPGRTGAGLATVAQSLDFQSPAYTQFFGWAGRVHDLPQHFPATLWLYEYSGDTEYRETIERFWSGGKLTVAELKKNLRSANQLSTYNIHTLPRQRELAWQRFRFASALALGAGYKGWIVLLDEVELIGRYGVKARARSYEVLARLAGKVQDGPGGGIRGMAAVAAISEEFDSSVLRDGKCDAEMVPNKLRASGRDEDAELATLAERGINLILNDRLLLRTLESDDVQRAHARLRRIYSDAFDWDASELPRPPIRTSEVMRPLVRRWITEWDLLRLFPGSQPDILFTPLKADHFDEDHDLEAVQDESE